MKSNFIKSTIILIIGGFITKILSMIIKIAQTRVLTSSAIGLYMLILPTFNLFITLSTLGLPTAISKLVSEKRKSSKKIVLSTIPIIIIFNILLMLILISLAPLISKYLLNNNDTYYPIISIGLTLPFICLSSIIRGYFFGKEKMFPHILSNIVEQIIRLILTIYFIPNLLHYGIINAICGLVLINIASELTSIITLILFIPKNKQIKKEDFKCDKEILKDILNISIPTTSSRLIGSISYFLEPIILTYTLLKVGYDTNYITVEYGIINAYVYPLLLLPSFFSLAISNALLPVISNAYVNKQYNYIKNKIKQAIKFSLLIGIPFTLIFIIIPQIPLKIIYNTTSGINYIKVIAPFFLLHYIQAPLTVVLQAINKAKCAMQATLYASIIRLATLFIISLFKVGLWSLVIASIINIVFVTIHHIYYTKKYLKKPFIINSF